jgi:hypothetical protein
MVEHTRSNNFPSEEIYQPVQAERDGTLISAARLLEPITLAIRDTP